MRFGRKQNTDLSKDLFATIGGVKGKQFGRDVYSTVLKFKDLNDFLEVFPNVQRQLNKGRIFSIKKYILSGLNNNTNMRFFSSVTATCRGTIFFDEDKQRVAIDTRSKMSLNDGQHRYQAIREAIREIEGLINKNTRNKEVADSYRAKLDELNNMIIPVIIFDGLSEVEEKQLFHDLNNLQQRPSKSANIKLSQTDLFARMSRELLEENRYLKHYGVETDKAVIGRNNPNTFLLTSLHSTIKTAIQGELTIDNYETNKKYISETLDKLFFVLPHDINTKGKYILDKNYSLVGLIKFITEARKNMLIEEDTIFETIKNGDFTNNLDIYSQYGCMRGNSGNVIFSSSTYGVKAIYNYMNDSMNEFLSNKEKAHA